MREKMKILLKMGIKFGKNEENLVKTVGLRIREKLKILLKMGIKKWEKR